MCSHSQEKWNEYLSHLYVFSWFDMHLVCSTHRQKRDMSLSPICTRHGIYRIRMYTMHRNDNQKKFSNSGDLPEKISPSAMAEALKRFGHFFKTN